MASLLTRSVWALCLVVAVAAFAASSKATDAIVPEASRATNAAQPGAESLAQAAVSVGLNACGCHCSCSGLPCALAPQSVDCADVLAKHKMASIAPPKNGDDCSTIADATKTLQDTYHIQVQCSGKVKGLPE